MLRNHLIIALSLALLASGCSRYADKKPLVDAPAVVIGPSHKDVHMVKDGEVKTPEQIKVPTLNGEMQTADYFRLIDELKSLSTATNSEDLGALAKEMYGSFYKNGDTYTKNSFSRFYMEAMLGQAQPEAQKQLTVIARDISVAKQKLTALLDSSAATYPWPKEINHLNKAILAADDYVNWLMKAIPRLGLSPEVTRPVTAAMRTFYYRYRPGFAEMANSMENARDFGQAVNAVKKALTRFDVKLPPEQAELLEKADNLAQELATMESSQDALTLIIDVWRLVPEASREQVFKPVVPELYDYLKDKSDLSLSCLAASICINPVLEVSRRIGILPKLSEYGVRKIHDQVEGAAREYLIKETRKVAGKLIPQIPVQARNQIVIEAEKYQTLISSIQADFPGFGRSHAAAWGAKEFSQELRGIETSKIDVNVGGRGRMSVQAKEEVGKRVHTGAETLGLSLSLSHEFLPQSGDRLKAALLEPVLKLLAISGFTQLSGKQFPAMLLPLDGKPGDQFKIDELLKGNTSFAVPDSFVANPDFFTDRAKAPKNSSVVAQAELLRGIARQVRFHRDWEKNVFDEVLGSIPVEDLAPEIPKGAIDLSIFPKDLIFALSLGDAGGLLQNIVRPASPAFLLLPSGELLWGDHYKEIGEGKVSTVAGLVSIEDGARGATVRTADIARYILALSEFVDATEGVENTKAGPLLSPDADGKRIVDQLVDARRYLRLLQMGLTNFLVSVAQEKSGAIKGTFLLENGKLVKSDTALSLEDQLLTIRALLASAKTLDLPIFRWAALDAYYFLNRNFWDKRAGFYASGVVTLMVPPEKANLHQVTLGLLTGSELAPYMNDDSRAQWQRISDPWIQALERF